MPGQGNRIDFVTGAPEKYADIVDALSVVPSRYQQALGRVADAAMRVEPAEPEGAWSPQRILAHVTFLAEANEVFIHQQATMTDPVRKAFPPPPASRRTTWNRCRPRNCSGASRRRWGARWRCCRTRPTPRGAAPATSAASAARCGR